VKPGNRVAVEVRQIVPDDGEVIQGLAAIEESAITGESAPVICEAQGVQSCVSAGTLVVSGQSVIQITSGTGTSFLDRMVLLMRGAGSDPKQDRIRAASEPVAVAGLTLPEPFGGDACEYDPNVPSKTTDTSPPDVANSGLSRQGTGLA